ncbi:ABC-F family ATP-binding cassette domain-containing protein [Ferviditalea candida]|uniref:ABC-F family ATP-binding cassette domain-containing protein n=1 Tax=Ferviditalea candida TaxID=3108399 RepID=A0ABU5ZFE7_9BACL|nr:ABC-F family ATP-binding cassette domain-containing protein [Paenibacillaceae bacterium T2]
MLLQTSGLSKFYGTKTVLSNISLQIQERERIGLVGVNGAGKSTLLRILAGEMSYDQGEIFMAKETRLGYLAQNGGLQSGRSIREEMLAVFSDLTDTERELRSLEQRMADPVLTADGKNYDEVMKRYASLSEWFSEQGGYEIEAKIRGVLHGMGFKDFDPGTPIETLSGGQKTRLALAKLLLQAPDLLLLDEPTNHLDIPTLTWLENYLRSYSGAILVVSHDRYFLDSLVHTIYEIERTTSKRYTGNYSKYAERKAAEYEVEMKRFEKQQEEISRMEDFIRRNIVRASTTKRAQSRRNMLERMDRLDKPQGELKKAHFSFEIERMTGRDVLHVDQLSASYTPEQPLFKDVSFHMERGDTAALIGPNGIGKSTLLKVLTGKHQPDTGTFQWGSNVKIGYYDQEQTGLNANNTVLEEVWGAFPHLEEVKIRTVLGNFLFSGDDVLKRISSLSGGEKARVALSKLMLEKANVLILDEPTNHLDLYSKEVLESALLDYEGTLLFISHDRYFLNKMAERIIELTPSGANHFLGNYDDYSAKKQELVEISMESDPLMNEEQRRRSSEPAKTGSPAPASGSGNSQHFEAEKQAKREERNRQRKLERLERDIADLESTIALLEEELAHPDVFNDYVKLQEKQAEIDSKKTRLEQCYEEWSLLAE